VKLWNDLCDWAVTNAAAFRLCFRMTIAGLLAYVLADVFALPQGYWAVFSAIIVIQASVGGSVKATIDRVERSKMPREGELREANLNGAFLLRRLHRLRATSSPPRTSQPLHRRTSHRYTENDFRPRPMS
jgi:hypothetical protein